MKTAILGFSFVAALVMASTAVAATPMSLSASPLSGGDHLFVVTPGTATVYIHPTNGHANSVAISGLCNRTPCSISWKAILSNDRVGSIDTTTGPVVHFTAGTLPGAARIIGADGNGNIGYATVVVKN